MYQFDASSIFRGVAKPKAETKAAGEHPPRMVMNRRESRRQVKSNYKDSLQGTDYSFAIPPNTPIIDRCETTPSDLNDDLAEIKRTGTGGMMLFRKKSPAEQEIVSQARALDMIEKYELGEDKSTELNKIATFKKWVSLPTTKFSVGHQSAKEATQTHTTKSQEEESKKAQKADDALRNNRESKQMQQKSTNVTTKTSFSSILSRPPLRNKQTNEVNISDDALLKAKALQKANEDGENSDELGVEIVMDGVNGTVTLLPSPTGVEAIAPSARGYFYQLPNGRTFDIPHLC